MTVLEHLRHVLAESIERPLADVGIGLTEDRSGYTVARYEGRKGGFDREVTVVRDKWWSKNRGRFTIFLSVCRSSWDRADLSGHRENSAEIPLADLMELDSHDWKIWASDEAAPFIETLGAGMIEHGIPWLERLSDKDTFERWIEDEGI